MECKRGLQILIMNLCPLIKGTVNTYCVFIVRQMLLFERYLHQHAQSLQKPFKQDIITVFIIEMKKSVAIKLSNLPQIASLLSGTAKFKHRELGPYSPCSYFHSMKGRKGKRVKECYSVTKATFKTFPPVSLYPHH